MRKIISKIAGTLLGLSLAVGVGVAVANSKPTEAKAGYEATTSIAVDDVVVFGFDNGTVKKELKKISTFGSNDVGEVQDFTGSAPSGVYPLTVVSGSKTGTFAFKDSDNNYLAWLSGNTLTKQSSISDNSSWSINSGDVDGTTLKLTNAKDTARKLQYNSGNPRLATYTSSQSRFSIYKYVSDEGPKITIKYDANGGGGTMDDTVASAPTAAACAFTAPEGQRFLKWNVAADGSGADYKPGDAVSSDIKLYAIWGVIPTYTCAQAISAIDSSGDVTNVYVTGYVVALQSTSVQSGKISYWLADTKGGEKAFEVYLGLGLNGENFSALTDVQVGAVVKVYGSLTKFGTTYETSAGAYLITYTAPATTLVSIAVSNEKTDYKVGDTFVKPTVTATYDDESTADVTASAVFSGFDSSSAIASQTISVSYTQNDVEKTTSYTISITALATNTYMKVTEELEDYSGHYLIVYESDALKCAFDGSLSTLDAVSDYQEVSISDSKISLEEKYEFVISRVSGKDTYTIKSASGKYIGRTTDSNGMNESTTDAYESTIGFDNGEVVVTATSNAVLRFNKNSGQTRFRYFKSSSASGQQAIALYKRMASTAEQFAEDLLAQTSATCDAYDSTSDLGSKAKFQSIWSELSGAKHYGALSDAEKLSLAQADAKESGSTLEKAAARYDFITGKYSLNNFITGRTPMAFAQMSISHTVTDSNASTIIIVVVALTSITSIGVLLVIKRRRVHQ